LTLSVTNRKKLQGTWISEGRLEVLVGVAETKKAIAEKWYPTKKVSGNRTLIFYTEESQEAIKEKVLKKEVKGGCSLEIDDGKTAHVILKVACLRPCSNSNHMPGRGNAHNLGQHFQ
jgi:hypothetical protein